MSIVVRSFAAAVATAALAGLPLAVSAAPSFAESGVHADASIHGRVQSFDGKYALTIRDKKGFIDRVQLHQGTIINPTGLTLSSGQRVTIYGYNAGHVFDANEIDTPYTESDVAAQNGFPVGYGYPAYAYPAYGFGGPVYGYGYAPGVSFGVGF